MLRQTKTFFAESMIGNLTLEKKAAAKILKNQKKICKKYEHATVRTNKKMQLP